MNDLGIPTPLLSRILNVATMAALRAGELLRHGFNAPFEVREKQGRKNLVTTYDEKSEECIISMIKEHFSDHIFLSEECGALGKGKDKIKWIIDPLDGTVNFAYNIPLFSVSIAAVYNGQVLAGVVYAPMLHELFCAINGGGAFFNGKPIRVSTQKELDESLLATGLPYNTRENPRHCIEHLTAIVKKGIPLRRMGSAAIDLAYLACGRFDGFWEASLQPWDYAAAKLLIEEAGGTFTDLDNNPISTFGESSIVASNAHIHKQLITAFKDDHG
jgi:myo-inositol-1(or 4)-monophosphatase